MVPNTNAAPDKSDYNFRYLNILLTSNMYYQEKCFTHHRIKLLMLLLNQIN